MTKRGLKYLQCLISASPMIVSTVTTFQELSPHSHPANIQCTQHSCTSSVVDTLFVVYNMQCNAVDASKILSFLSAAVTSSCVPPLLRLAPKSYTGLSVLHRIHLGLKNKSPQTNAQVKCLLQRHPSAAK